MILFDKNWKQEVRDYFRPLLVNPSPAHEMTANLNLDIYKLHILTKQERTRTRDDHGHWGEFLLRNARFHHLTSLTHCDEVAARITWVKKLDCPSPICALASAILIENNFDLKLHRVVFPDGLDGGGIRIVPHDYDMRLQCAPLLFLAPDESYFNYGWDYDPIMPSTNPKLPEFAKIYWGRDGKPLPQLDYEKELKHWQFYEKWNFKEVLFETEENFIFWNWMMTA